MSPSRRVLNTLVLPLAATVALAGPVRAQFYDRAVSALDLSTDVPRSPRLLGMGGLSLVIPDRNNAITLWDFAGSPAGAFEDDSLSTLEIRPGTSSVSGAHEDFTNSRREDLGGRASRFDFEAFHRNDRSSAYGATGRVDGVRSDVPFADDLELRRTVSVPELTPILTGLVPYFNRTNLRYGVRAHFGGERQRDEYRTILTNAAGQFITLDGETVVPPDFFTPDDYRVNTSGAGAAVSYALAKHTVLALGFDAVEQRIKGSNNGNRYSSEQKEKRPYGIGQATLLGRFGTRFEYGVDGRAWTSESERDWLFTISAGVGAFPLSGRGKLLTREEKGSALNGRARWLAGPLELGGLFWTQASKVNYAPPAAGDLSAFNYFLNTVYYRQNADTLAKPDSVVAFEQRTYAWGYGVGGSWKLPRGVLGAEWHWSRDLFQQTMSGQGPKRIAWDVRAGYEFPCTPVVTGRLGGGYGWTDLDDLTLNNEYVSESASLGMGLHPPGSSWTFELGYALEWAQSDFGDPGESRRSRQRLASQIHWGF